MKTPVKAFGGAQSIPGHLGMHNNPFYNGGGQLPKGTFHPEDFNKKIMSSPSSSASSTNSFQPNLGHTFHPELRNDIGQYFTFLKVINFNNILFCFIDKAKEHSDEPVCQLYRGTRCQRFLGNKTVYIPAPLTQKLLEEKLNTAFTVIEHSQ